MDVPYLWGVNRQVCHPGRERALTSVFHLSCDFVDQLFVDLDLRLGGGAAFFGCGLCHDLNRNITDDGVLKDCDLDGLPGEGQWSCLLIDVSHNLIIYVSQVLMQLYPQK